jgi:3-phosphoinositide dependent protein kinase-1
LTPRSLPLTLRDFELLRRIGEGSFSHVVLARLRATGQQYALKVVDKAYVVRHGAVEALRRERAILDRLTHPGVVRLHFTFQDALSVYLGLEYCPGGELFDQIRAAGRLGAGAARFYAAEVVLMLGALREAGVVHRDLKPENLLLAADGHLKLVDFGSAKELPTAAAAAPAPAPPETEGGPAASPPAPPEAPEAPAPPPPPPPPPAPSPFKPRGARSASLVGTADYVSPEVLHNRGVTFAADLWALGCVLHHMLSGRPPFRAASEYLTFQRVAAGDADPLPEGAPPAAAALVGALLRVDPGERLGARDLGELRAHPFFEGVDWGRLREGPAPEPAPTDDDRSLGSGASSFDWCARPPPRNAAALLRSRPPRRRCRGRGGVAPAAAARPRHC